MAYVTPWESRRALDETRDKWNALIWWSEGRGIVPPEKIPKALRDAIHKYHGQFRDIYKNVTNIFELKPLTSRFVVLDPIAFFRDMFGTYYDELQVNVAHYNRLAAEAKKVAKSIKRPLPKQVSPITVDPFIPDVKPFGVGVGLGLVAATAAFIWLFGERILPRSRPTTNDLELPPIMRRAGRRVGRSVRRRVGRRIRRVGTRMR